MNRDLKNYRVRVSWPDYTFQTVKAKSEDDAIEVVKEVCEQDLIRHLRFAVEEIEYEE